MAALTASRSSKVLVIEKRKVPGTPVNTTGAVPIEWLTKMGVLPPADRIAGKLRGVEFVSPKGERACIRNSEPDGMVLYPDAYVKWLSEKASDRGAEIMTDTLFKTATVKDGADPEATVETSRGTFKGRYLVGADGAASNVGRVLGVGSRPAPEDLHIGIEYTVSNNKVQDPEVFRLYLGHDVAPQGYAWSFPEGPDRLKVGLGIPQSTGLTAKTLMTHFVERYPEFKGDVTKSNGGIIPTAPPLKSAVKGNVLLVGDAAHFCSPLHGGGIWFGMLSGHLAGVALNRGDPGGYDRLWKNALGGILARHYKLKMVIYDMSDQNFEDMVKMLKTYVRVHEGKMGMPAAARSIFFSDPSFIAAMAFKWSKKGLALDAIRRMVVPGFRIA